MSNIFKGLGRTSSLDQPSQLMTLRLAFEKDRKTLADFLLSFDFVTKDALADAIGEIVHLASEDVYFASRDHQKSCPSIEVLYKRSMRLRTQAGALEKYKASVASELWYGHFAPTHRSDMIAKMFASEPSKKEYRHAAERMQKVYHLSDLDVTKMRFFCCQTKAGREFPKSLRRMLYIWGRAKKTGKTTTAGMIVSVLNGEDDWRQASRYETDLATELQIKQYAVPRISEYRCCMMDECFYADMGKTYHTFKNKITAVDGTSRLPYGQEFEWKGLPNYVATSNEPLKSFIKDWDDRRFLAVEFSDKPEPLSFDEAHELIRAFVVNAYVPEGYTFETWAAELDDLCNEEGEKGVIADEYEMLLKSNDFATLMIQKNTAVSRTCNANRLSLLQVINALVDATHDNTIRSHRQEVETAFIKCFGDRVPGQKYWYISDVCEVIQNGGVKEKTEKKYYTLGDLSEEDAWMAGVEPRKLF